MLRLPNFEAEDGEGGFLEPVPPTLTLDRIARLSAERETESDAAKTKRRESLVG
jgi:hypothetical protein